MHRQHTWSIHLVRLFTVALLLLGAIAFGSSALALPTAPPSPSSRGGFHPYHGHGPGPALSGKSSHKERHEENAHEDWRGGDNSGHDGDDDGNASPVPEPTSVLLMSLGLAGAAYMKRRRKQDP